MTSQYSLPVVHPAFELLKRSARILHFIAASLILTNAIGTLQAHSGNIILAYTQIVIAADIYLLVFLGGPLLSASPRLNLLFRFIEGITLAGTALVLMKNSDAGYGFLQLLISGGYFFLFYREWRVIHSEAVNIKATGITIPNFIKDAEIGWDEIRTIIPRYHSIIIERWRHKRVHFKLRNNLKIEELQQIDEFCRKHLNNG